MARHTSTLAVELLDRVTGPAKKVASSLARLGSNLGDVTSVRTRLDAAMARNDARMSAARGGLVDAAAGALALAGAFKGTLGSAMSLEDKMADIGKVSDMNAEQLKGFELALRKMAAKEIPMAVEQLAELAAAASASGIDDSDLEAFTRQVAKSAVAWEVSGQYAGESLAKLKTALGMTIGETSRYADAINYLSDATASNAPDLVEFARRVAADGKVAGFTNETVLALGASMISMGAEADVAATSLRNAQKALTRGASATKRQDAAFRKLGLSAEGVAKRMPDDALGQFLMVLEKIRALDQHEQIATMSDLFGDEARALMPLLGQLDEMRKNTAAVADETNYLGSVQKEFEIRAQTGRYALQRFNNQLKEVGISIGSALLPAMKRILETMGPVLAAVANWTEKNPDLVASIAGLTAGLIGLRVALAAFRLVSALTVGSALRIASGMLKIATAVTTLVTRIGLIGPAMTTAATQTEAASRRMNTALNGIKWKALGAGLGLLAFVPEINRQTEETRKRWEESGAIPKSGDDAAARQRAADQLSADREAKGKAWARSLGFDPDAPLPGRAKGGPISRGNTYQVGEEGPEVITARRSGYVHPNGSGSGGQISISAPITVHQLPGENIEALAGRLKRLFETEIAFSMRSAFVDFQTE